MTSFETRKLVCSRRSRAGLSLINPPCAAISITLRVPVTTRRLARASFSAFALIHKQYISFQSQSKCDRFRARRRQALTRDPGRERYEPQPNPADSKPTHVLAEAQHNSLTRQRQPAG